MQTFLTLLAVLGFFITLSYHFSVWAAFGIIYVLGMFLMAILGLFGRRLEKSRQETLLLKGDKCSTSMVKSRASDNMRFCLSRNKASRKKSLVRAAGTTETSREYLSSLKRLEL
jgi:hypothetical protein